MKYAYRAKKGLSRALIEKISKYKNEPLWMKELRLCAYEIFLQKPMPTWGADLSGLNLDAISYYIRPEEKMHSTWEEVPQEIKETFEALGVPQSERKFLAGTGAQFESEMVYHSLQQHLREKGVIFEPIEVGLQKYPNLFREYFGKIIPANDNKFAALNTAVWSGGTFLYVPKNTYIELPLQAYFRINAENMGQFERSLIIADEGSFIHYIEGCTAPVYSTDSLHAAVVELVAKKNAKIRYTTIQNWSKNIYNLVTKRAHAYKNAEIFWLDINIGSKATMKYPAIHLKEQGAKGEVQSFAIAGKNQHIDAGAKIFHSAKDTSSFVLAKSISKDGGRSSYRGITKINENAKNSRTKTICDALILDDKSRSDTYPANQTHEIDAIIEHEATVSKIGESQLFYAMSRGLDEKQASSLIVNGFAEPIINQLPMEYAVELNRLIELET